MCRRRPVKVTHHTSGYIEDYAEENEVWLVWTDKSNETHAKSIRQLAHEARQGNTHDESVLTYYRYSFLKEKGRKTAVEIMFLLCNDNLSNLQIYNILDIDLQFSFKSSFIHFISWLTILND